MSILSENYLCMIEQLEMEQSMFENTVLWDLQEQVCLKNNDMILEGFDIVSKAKEFFQWIAKRIEKIIKFIQGLLDKYLNTSFMKIEKMYKAAEKQLHEKSAKSVSYIVFNRKEYDKMFSSFSDPMVECGKTNMHILAMTASPSKFAKNYKSIITAIEKNAKIVASAGYGTYLGVDFYKIFTVEDLNKKVKDLLFGDIETVNDFGINDLKPFNDDIKYLKSINGKLKIQLDKQIKDHNNIKKKLEKGVSKISNPDEMKAASGLCRFYIKMIEDIRTCSAVLVANSNKQKYNIEKTLMQILPSTEKTAEA